MKIALIGHGAMGRLVEYEAVNAGDTIGVVLTSRDKGLDLNSLTEKLSGHDVAIDFSTGDAVLTNVAACMRARIPLVEGTTGWRDHESEVKQIVGELEGALVYGPNFSIGVHMFYRLVEYASSLMASLETYEPFIEEAHHSRKRDAPSGTALKLAELMRNHYQKDIPTVSTRAGFIPGTHRVGFDAAADQILLTHTARSRQGFAAGALFSARWIVGKSGVHEFSEVISELVDQGGDNKRRR
jgi:4-hydroxy-tetrahydrodipicolinate reductase